MEPNSPSKTFFIYGSSFYYNDNKNNNELSKFNSNTSKIVNEPKQLINDENKRTSSKRSSFLE